MAITTEQSTSREAQFTVGGVTFNLRLTLLVILSTLLPMLDFYNIFSVGVKAYDRLILYFVAPMLIILFLFREKPAAYGFQIGDWRAGLKWALFASAGMALLLWFLAQTPQMQSYYAARATGSAGFIVYITAVDLWGWEFIWRGFLLFGLARLLGPGPAILLQAVPFAFMHLGKPEIETLSTIFGGAAFGYIAWQTRSFLYPFFIHWFIAVFTQLVARASFF